MDEPVCGDELYMPGIRNAGGTQEGCSAVRQALYVLEQRRPHRSGTGRERIHPYMCIARPFSRYIRITIARNRIYVLENQHR